MKCIRNLPAINSEDLEDACTILHEDCDFASAELNSLKSNMSIDDSDSHFQKIQREKPILNSMLQKIKSIYSSSYNCEQGFSNLNFILNKYRSALNQEHTEDLLMIKMTKRTFDFDHIVKKAYCQISH